VFDEPPRRLLRQRGHGSILSSVKSETADRFESCGDAKMELFDYIEVFYNQRRRQSTLGQVSPAAFERRANEEERRTTETP
jgi:transposase InsO family protein